MTADEYVPSEEDFIDSWACAHVTPHDMTVEEAKDAARAFLARVRRDAAREALDGLAAWHDERAEYIRRNTVTVADYALLETEEVRAANVRAYRDAHYPEEEGHHA